MDPIRAVLFPMEPMTSTIRHEGSGCRSRTSLETRLAILRRTVRMEVRHDPGRPAEGNPGARAQIEALRSALSDVTRPYTELMAYVGRLQDVSRGYFRILDLYAKYGKVSPDLVIPGLKDDISRHIVVALFDRPDRSISQITEAVKGKRGTASRRIVRERLEDLERQGIVVATPGSRTRTFRVAEEVADKWSQVLGVPKYQDHPHEDSHKVGERDE